MKWSLVIAITMFFTSQLLMARETSGQNLNSTYVQLGAKNEPLSFILRKIETETGFTFVYRSDLVNNIKHVYLDKNEWSLSAMLDLLFKYRGLSYRQIGKNILIFKTDDVRNKKSDDYSLDSSTWILLNKPDIKPFYSAAPHDTLRFVKGRIVSDATGDPVYAASINIERNIDSAGHIVKRLSAIGISKQDGTFEVRIPQNIRTLIISSIGYVVTPITLSVENVYDVRLLTDEKNMDEVVVTGMMNFNKRTFSGATSTYSGTQLKTITNTNVITALKSLDPSFLIMENNDQGSNPNTLPTINLRGTTSINSSNLQDEFSSDVNQPLFILDNFETDLRTVLDLDMNRIASITLLKDAASTAIYGSRASNGVVVIETIKPTTGKVKLSYNSDWNFEFADLSGYNMMNAAEKLEFERLSGMYTASSSLAQMQSSYYDPIYSQRLQDVLSGVNTYWLSVPLHNAVSQRHGLYVEGGSDALKFNAGGSFKNQEGVMKGSGRKDWSGRLNLTYRKGNLNINNNLQINGYNSQESPYGAFSTWVNTNPYYRKIDDDSMYLYTFYDPVSYSYLNVVNPLYNASLNSFDKSKNWGFSNNLSINYNINRYLRFTGTFQVSKYNSETNEFTSPLNSKYVDVNYLKKGNYYYYNANSFSYTGSGMLSYARVFHKHSININTRVEVSNSDNQSLSFTAVGFPSSSNGNVAFAYGYAEGSSPYSKKSVKRRNSFVNSLSYTYNQKYTADISYNVDGSTAFGKNNVYNPFYSFGASWNLGTEDFIRSIGWISMLRLRANYGVTGNQGFSSYTSVTTYNYLDNYNYTGTGVEVGSLGNPDLKWQKTYQVSYGVDGSFLDRRMSIDINGYSKRTNPLVVDVDVPVSTGVSSTPFNAGQLLVKGIDGTISYSPIFRPQKNIVWTIRLTGSYYTQKYSQFGDLLNSINDSLVNSSSLQRYKDGYAPDDIWAVKSLGIDPATGREIFLKKDGTTRTYTYSSSDAVKVGNTRPAIQGVVGSSLSLHGFTFSANFRYIIRQDALNSALYNKVENISSSSVINNNQDKRALYDRWKEPGDIAQFKAISLTSSTPISSRFIQRENSFSLESCSIGYDLSRTNFIRHSGLLSSLRLSGYMNDIFKLTTVRRERGISYPYSRYFSFSLTANFK